MPKTPFLEPWRTFIIQSASLVEVRSLMGIELIADRLASVYGFLRASWLRQSLPRVAVYPSRSGDLY